jgi:Kef-type K+ transport system membrane component KefB
VLPSDAAPAVSATVGTAAESMILHVLLQIVVILLVTRIVVFVAKSLGQTDVAGEILGGIVLGPSLLGAIAPDVIHRVFDPKTAPVFVGFAQVGLVLLMFQIGLEFEFGAKLRSAKRAIAIVSLLGMIVPFVSGLATAGWFFARMPEPRPPLDGFRLFFAIAMSITAIPILGRIFMELRLSHTRIASLTVGAAAVDDIAGWLLLGVVTLLVQHRFSGVWMAYRIGALVAYMLLAWFVVRPLLRRAMSAHLARKKQLEAPAICAVLVLVFGSGAITSYLGVFAIIGGFVMGVLFHDDRVFVEEWKMRVSPLVNALFLPIFFAYTGLRTNIGALAGGEWITCGAVIAVAFLSKFGGAYLGGRISGESPRSAAVIGVCMNTRALMELVALNVGFDLGVIPKTMFTILVVMAIASTYIATPLIRFLLRVEQRPAVLEPEARAART